MAAEEVRTTAGAVRGRREDGLTVFRGMPFAAPPVGSARFQAPTPPAPWAGVRDAYEFGPPPPQETGLQGTPATGGDDWLTANVWTPEPAPQAPRPVMVWIYGGAYRGGHASSPGYDAQHLSRKGDVVVVTFNYRVGIEGFLHIEGAPANRGLLDQIAALEWVRDNIAEFGGDPGNVTVFGESAGAGSVAALLAAPSARGLFHRAIAQSIPVTYFSAPLARDIAAALAAEAGVRPTAADLATIPPRKLPEAGEALSAKMAAYTRWGQVAPTSVPYSPVVDGDILPKTPWQAASAGEVRDIDLLIGHNSQEYRLFTVMGNLLGRITEDQATAALRMYAPGGGEPGERAYREAFPDATAQDLFERVQSDWLFAMPSLYLAEAQLAAGGSAHLYELTWTPPAHGGILRGCHALDVPLLFGTYAADMGAVVFPDGEVPPDAADLTARFQTSWTSFARTGDPGWAAYDLERGLTQILDTPSEVSRYPEETARGLWEGYEWEALPLVD
ncbi:carboxylesterase/lipase family protein [Streptomyces acidiscabies]|uniref:Carboxylic ester hydrolase n=1 Tax=Streptomyces acidiscabies TaxID=42234 RepID=A0AAP6BD86_9ACTN|nr:carboxylesterase family protein [Streptomyces acidiscabies]MBP5938814.1 carboxylesterase/lipase family protein [Streptomyces sp. LBUM 1476]MBZ3909929.1 carboxylesterase/lipase family protein [Streptomyces acidiscabies]MDX2962596.1 carboxylesterase family protein [Streptomyces acidiscabies]MDX3020509.1 carboxylesterase family protein [Streptomyces acidiscabies]MDX3789977.1 carboxylesterase family protein [Streptomyces acidiscabies]